MASAVKKCRVCGKDYEACRSANRIAGVFRWQEVACSPECGAEYLRLITESRNPTAPKVVEPTPQEVVETYDLLEDDDEETETDEHDDIADSVESEDEDLL